MHWLDPGSSLKNPGGHPIQTCMPVVLEMYPGGQSSQLCDSGYAEYDPIGHG
jgi:hypothetical protein